MRNLLQYICLLRCAVCCPPTMLCCRCTQPHHSSYPQASGSSASWVTATATLPRQRTATGRTAPRPPRTTACRTAPTSLPCAQRWVGDEVRRHRWHVCRPCCTCCSAGWILSQPLCLLPPTLHLCSLAPNPQGESIATTQNFVKDTVAPQGEQRQCGRSCRCLVWHGHQCACPHSPWGVPWPLMFCFPPSVPCCSGVHIHLPCRHHH